LSTGSVKTSTLGSLIGSIKASCCEHQLTSAKDVDKLSRSCFVHAGVRDSWEELAQAVKGA
jgi:hypothetical protein